MYYMILSFYWLCFNFYSISGSTGIQFLPHEIHLTRNIQYHNLETIHKFKNVQACFNNKIIVSIAMLLVTIYCRFLLLCKYSNSAMPPFCLKFTRILKLCKPIFYIVFINSNNTQQSEKNKVII